MAHRTRVLCYLLSLCGLLFALLPAAAQEAIDLSETYSFEDGTSFAYPSDWTLEKRPTYLKIFSNDTEIYIVTPADLEEAGITDTDNPSDLLEALFEALFGDALPFESDDLQELEIGGREAVRYDYVDNNDNQSSLIAIQFNDQSYGIIYAISKIGDLTEDEVVLAVTESFNHGEGDTVDDAEADTEPCTVSTESRGTVAIRVGPGTNRTSYAFLPPGQDFTVLGQATADDGSLWWKLDKEEAAPGKSAAEAWVAQEDVEAQGGCDSVVDASAPPVIPIVAAPPTSGGGGSTDPGQPPAAGDILPQSGSWTEVYSRTASVSCLDVPPENVDIDAPPDTYSLSVRDGGASLVYGGEVYTRTQPNTYVGNFNSSEFGSVRLVLRVISPTQMSGELTINLSENGRQCSGTVYSTITHN